MTEERPYASKRFVGFVDLLGYRHLVLSGEYSDESRFELLKTVYEALIQAAMSSRDLGDIEAPVRRLHFSDCFYFSSGSALAIIGTMSYFFADAFGFNQVFVNSGEAWMPFLRGGIVKDWFFEAFDPTVESAKQPSDLFRNPIGPAVAKSYLLAEKSGTVGMRLVVTEDVTVAFREELATAGQSTPELRLLAQLSPLYLREQEKYGRLYEVPWFEDCLAADNTGGLLRTLQSAKCQFDAKSEKHYWGTLDAISHCPTVAGTPALERTVKSMRANEGV